MKGDSAFLFVQSFPSTTTTTDTQSIPLSMDTKDTIRTFITKALSQKGDLIENLKIFRIIDINTNQNTRDRAPSTSARTNTININQPYVLVDFAYQLNTEAGFLISRRGIATITNAGTYHLQGLMIVSTEQRYNKNDFEKKLRTIAESFRVYRLNSGIFAASTIPK
jgi:hypothetical protein